MDSLERGQATMRSASVCHRHAVSAAAGAVVVALSLLSVAMAPGVTVAARVTAPAKLRAVVAAVTSPGAGAASTWSWDHTHTWVDFGDSSTQGLMTQEQATFVANHYEYVSIEKCNAGGSSQPGHNSTEQNFAFTARQLVAANPNVKVLYYWASDQVVIGCYACANEFVAHPDWELRNSSGGSVGLHQPVIDVTIPAARDWWVNAAITVLKGSLDYVAGAFVDSAGQHDFTAQIGAARNAAWNAAHEQMVRQLTDAMHALRPDLVALGNELSEYPPPISPPDHGLGDLVNMDGACAEHFGAFEGVADGAMNGTRMESWVDVITKAAALGKTVIVKTWPGPVVEPIQNGGPSWPNKTAADWTYTERQAAAARALDWSHAAFLLTAAPNVYMSYSWWYNIADGVVPCTAASNSCSCPEDWYPQLSNALGKPLGPPQRASGGTGHVWTREFESVSVRVDLGDTGSAQLTWKQA